MQSTHISARQIQFLLAPRVRSSQNDKNQTIFIVLVPQESGPISTAVEPGDL